MNIKKVSLILGAAVMALAIALFLILRSCWDPCIDEKYAAKVLRDKLSLSGNVLAQQLRGGSGAIIYLATNDAKKYIVRFIKHKQQKNRELEIYNLKVASEGGYGPQIYFADLSEGMIIMEYLSGKMISDMEIMEHLSEKTIPNSILQSNQLYIALAHLLLKIHHGHSFKEQGDYVFGEIRKKLRIAQSKYSAYVPLKKIDNIVRVIHQALLPHLTTITPCHNDLHRDNLIPFGNEFKAIDYETASQGDPFFDVATVAASFFCKPKHEGILVSTYLGRQPSEVEQAKLYLMKQAVWIKWFFDDLRRTSPENIQQFGLVKTLSIMNLAREVVDGTIDMSKPENKLKLLKTRLNEIFTNFESQEFKDAVTTLNKQDSLLSTKK